jgi:hypothetical protein
MSHDERSAHTQRLTTHLPVLPVGCLLEVGSKLTGMHGCVNVATGVVISRAQAAPHECHGRSSTHLADEKAAPVRTGHSAAALAGTASTSDDRSPKTCTG